MHKLAKCFAYASQCVWQGRVDLYSALMMMRLGSWNFIIDGHITIEQFVALDFSVSFELTRECVQQFIIDGHITIEQFIALNSNAANALANEGVRQFIIDGHITIEQFRSLNHPAARDLATEGVRQFIIDGHTTIEQFVALNKNAAYALGNQGVRQSIINRRMTLNQLTRISTYGLYLAITHPDTIARINAGQLTVDEVIGTTHPAILNAYNRVQNTHTASVHKSVSESAKKLYDRYKHLIAGANLNNVIESLKNCIFEYAAPVIGKYNNRERDCLETAKAGLKRLTADNYFFTDASSGVSTLELLAMAYLAIEDNNKEEGVKAIILGLYEIERGYNIDKISTDYDASPSIHVCPGGTFNKIIEKLVGIDPDCSVVFVSQETVASKFRIILLDNIAQHLGADAEISDEVFSNDDWSKIWQAVKKDVKEQAHDEHSEVESELKKQALQWIEENIAGFDCGDCLLSKKDMQKIKDKLSKLQAKPALTL